jgi:hypothetical protein
MAHDPRNPLQQRCSYRACPRVELYQSAHSANCKIVASALLGATAARSVCDQGHGSTPVAPSRDAPILIPRSKGINQACGRYRVIRGRLQGPKVAPRLAGAGPNRRPVRLRVVGRGGPAGRRRGWAARTPDRVRWRLLKGSERGRRGALQFTPARGRSRARPVVTGRRETGCIRVFGTDPG